MGSNLFVKKSHFYHQKLARFKKKAISLHSVIKMVTAQSSSIDILPDADEEDCGVIIWWRRKPLPLNLK